MWNRSNKYRNVKTECHQGHVRAGAEGAEDQPRGEHRQGQEGGRVDL